MSDALASPAPDLAKLRSSLAQLTATLEPVMARPLLDLVASLEGGSSQPKSAASDQAGSSAEAGTKEEIEGRLDSARLQISLAYVLLDLVWMYLKVRGLDTPSHPVIAELERVKGYIEKINAAQGRSSDPSRSKVDTVAAGRFVRAALAQGAAVKPAGTHTRFDAAEEESESDSSNGDEKMQEAGTSASAEKAAASKEVAASKVAPYAGYEEGSSSKKRKDTDSSKDSKKKKKRKSKSGHK